MDSLQFQQQRTKRQQQQKRTDKQKNSIITNNKQTNKLNWKQQSSHSSEIKLSTYCPRRDFAQKEGWGERCGNAGKKRSGIPDPGISSDWLIVIVFVNSGASSITERNAIWRWWQTLRTVTQNSNLQQTQRWVTFQTWRPNKANIFSQKFTPE